MLYTTTNLVDSIVTRGQFPDSTNTKTISSPANLLNLATEELRIKILPMILDVAGDYYVKSLDIPVVANQAAYPLSTRVTGSVLRSIRLVNGSTDMPFSLLQPDDLPVSQGGTPYGYYFENNNIVLYDTPTSSGLTVKTRYFLRPSRLEQVSNCALISSIDTVNKQVVVASVPSSWGVGTKLDWISQDVPYALKSLDLTITAISSTTITFAALPSDGLVSDYLALAEYTPLPQIPEEYQPLLSQLVVCKVHEALGNTQGYQMAMADLKICTKNALSLITPRDQSHPKKIVASSWWAKPQRNF